MPHSKYPVKFKLAVVQEILSSQGRIQVARAPKGLHPRIQSHLRWLEKELKKVHDQTDTTLQNHPRSWPKAICCYRTGLKPIAFHPPAGGRGFNPL